MNCSSFNICSDINSKEEKLKEICERLKERNVIVEYGHNVSHTRYYMLLNLNNTSKIHQLDKVLVNEFKKEGYNAFTDGIGNEIFIKLK